MARFFIRAALAAGLALCGQAGAEAAFFSGYAPTLTTGTLINFEGFAEDEAISGQAGPGVTFSQTGGGLPKIDNLPAQFGYGASSGVGVLTGSGGSRIANTNGIIATFDAAQRTVQIFLSDSGAAFGNFTLTIFGAGGVALETVALPATSVLPPGYSGGQFPPAGTTPLPGIFVGFARASADIVSFQVGPNDAAAGNNAFAVDDLRFTTGAIPEPSSLILCGIGATLACVTRKALRRSA